MRKSIYRYIKIHTHVCMYDFKIRPVIRQNEKKARFA